MNESMNEETESIEENSRSSVIRLEFDGFRSTNHFLLAAIGIPLNLLIVMVILTNRRLKKKPRNILLLGVTLASVFTLLTILAEVLAHRYQDVVLCKIFGLSTGVAYTCLLYNLLLALLDRYLAVVYPLLHRKIISVRNVRIVQVIGAVVIFFLIKWPYIFGVIPLQCGLILLEGKTIAVLNALLMLLCVIFNVIVYTNTKHYTRPDRVLSVSFINNQYQDQSSTPRQLPSTLHQLPSTPVTAAPNVSAPEVSPPADENVNEEQVVINFTPPTNTVGSNSNHGNEPSPPTEVVSHTPVTPLQVHGGNRRMEVEATYTLLAGVSSLLIFTTPTLILAFINWGCHLVTGVEHEERCARIMIPMPYLRELLLYHLIYNAVMYMIRSKEFYSTLSEKWTMRRPPQSSFYIRNQITRHPQGHAQRNPRNAMTPIANGS